MCSRRRELCESNQNGNTDSSKPGGQKKMIEKIFSYTESGRVQLNAYIKSDVFRAIEVLLITSQNKRT